VHDSAFHGLIRRFDGRMIVLTDHGFVAQGGNPPHMKPVPKGRWNERMLSETFFALLTGVCHAKKMTPRAWEYFCTRLAFLLALFNILVQWEGLPLDVHGCAHRSLAHFSL
jgi:hypothetical protein